MELAAEARLVVERAVVVRLVAAEFAGPIVAREDAARARKFREKAQPMTSLRKL
jgi:hypothetical protein